jgi:N-acetyl-gamma-glutamyl-phosphate reductase
LTVLVLGSTGYAGMLLVRLLSSHPNVTSILAVSGSAAGRAVRESDPGLSRHGADKIPGGVYLSPDQAAQKKPDAVLAALPHLESSKLLEPYYGRSVVIDLAADFRIQDTAIFEKAYGTPPPRGDLLPQAVYGLCEVYRKQIKESDIIANPGCYPTASLLPIIPLLRASLIQGPIILNALSGITGAGKKARADYLFAERAENVNAYAPGQSHRHWAEMSEQAAVSGLSGELFFTPHLVPIRKGIEVTGVARLAPGTTGEAIRGALGSAYDGAPFVTLAGDRIPQTRDVRDTNRCDIGWKIEGEHLFFFSVIDNLMKGASGQAVQNMNIRFGLDEAAGLPLTGSS